MSSYRAALRIARRDALRSKGRTALIICMIGLPVAIIVAAGVLLKTMHWSPRESLPYEIGRADARLTAAGHAPVEQAPDGAVRTAGRGPAAERPWTTPEITRRVAAKYGPDTRVLPMRSTTSMGLATSTGRLSADLTELDLRDPMTRGMFEITEGRAPAAPDEIAVSPALSRRGLPIGSTARAGGGEGAAKRVVGLVRDPREPDDAIVVALPGSFSGDTVSRGSRHWLIDTGGSVTWSDVAAFNQDGIVVLSRAVLENPPPDLDTASAEQGAQSARRTVVAPAAAMVVLEVVLLAGPAFAVGVRRQRRLLALVSVAGGGPRHLRAVVLAGGLVLGGIAALAGTLLGIAAAAAVRTAAEPVTGRVPGPFEVPWLLVVATAALGVGSGLLAAYLPAWQAARADVAAALAGRRHPRRDGRLVGRRLPIAGAVLGCAGVLGCLFGTGPLRLFGAALGAVAIVTGTALAVPWLVGVAGRWAGALPVPLRLAVRDGARNVGRSAAAVVAIMAAVAGATALAIAEDSELEQARETHVAMAPEGTAMIWPALERAAGGRSATARSSEARLTEVRAAIERELPGVPLLDLRALPGSGCRVPVNPDCVSVTFAPGYRGGGGSAVPEIVVGGAAEARLLLGRVLPEVTAALDAGKIVLFGGHRAAGSSPGASPDAGTATATVTEWRQGRPKPRTIRRVSGLAAVTVAVESRVGALVPPSAAERIGVAPLAVALGVDRAEHRLTEEEETRVEEVLARFDGATPARVYVERGMTRSGDMSLPFLIVGAVSVLGGALIATRLAAADARPDLAVLAAVGARARTRRLLLAGQAGFIATLGCWLGIAAGLLPGIAGSRPPTGGYSSRFGVHWPVVDIPWPTLLAIGLVVPLIAAGAGGLFTRARTPVPHGTRS